MRRKPRFSGELIKQIGQVKSGVDNDKGGTNTADA